MEIKDKNPFAKKIAECREQNNLTQRQVAITCGVSLATYQNWEHGCSFPNEKNKKIICDLFGIDEDIDEDEDKCTMEE